MHAIAFSLLLAAALALTLLSQWRRWAPSLRVALGVGAALRAAGWLLAATQAWQPYDFKHDFAAAAAAVLHHHDPLLSGRARGWPFLPTMAFVLAGELKFGQLAHLPWQVVGRIAPVIADLVIIPLVGRLAGERGLLRGFQYACNPIAIMVCAIHGQLEPEILVLGVGALVVARSRRGAASDVAAGALLGLSLSIGTWSVLLAPGVVKSFPDLRQRVRACCVAAAVPVVILITSPLTVGTPVSRLPEAAHRIVSLRTVVGNWGWTALVTRGRMEFSSGVGRPGVLVLIAALLAAAYLWRRADPVDLTSALLIAFLLASPRVSTQYLVWPVPFLIARPNRYSTLALTAAAAWTAAGYVYLGPHLTPRWLHAYMWYLSSWDVIPLLILALPWSRRRDSPTRPEALAGQPATPAAVVGSARPTPSSVPPS